MHVRANPLPLLIALAPGIAGCAASGAPPADELRAPAAEPALPLEVPLEAEPAAAVEAIRRGDYESAHTILARLLFAGHLADARAALAAGSPEDALLDTEAALSLFPSDEVALLLHARASLALAEVAVAEGRPFAREMIEDALAAHQRAGTSAEARLGAARAAYLLNRPAEALALAREGMTTLGGREAQLDRLPQRIYAEAAFAAYVEKRATEGVAPAEQKESFQITEKALTSLLGRATDDPWVYQRLADLYEREGRLTEARDLLVRGVHGVPHDRGMVDRLAGVARTLGGSAEVLAVFEPLAERFPELAEAHWHEAYARFDIALTALERQDYRPDGFRASEAGFARCRALAPQYAENCTQYELMCRDALGWCLYHQGDVAGARAAFQSMEELKEGGLEWRLENRLLSGVQGLAFCAKAFYEKEDLIAAAEINDHLRGYLPDDATYANDAGFLFRDAAVELEYLGWRLCRASRGEVGSSDKLSELRALAGIGPEVAAGSSAEREALRAAADARTERARDLMRRSGDAYRAAARLAPEDVRIVNDAALVLVYYLHEDIEEARAMLERCVALAQQQVESPDPEQEARKLLVTAWGDALVNLGVVHIYYTGDKAAAIAHFERAIEVDPDAREEVRNFWLPYARGERGAPSKDEATPWSKDWGEPCR